jgi:dTDP-4-amino-4,6-dideoxygalactose transaminase
MARLEEDGVATRPGTHAAFSQGYYRSRYDLPIEEFSNAYLADRLSLSLPLYAGMSDGELEYVAAALLRALRT